MPVIPLIPSDSPTLISSLLHLSAQHLALAALASQPLKSGTLFLYLSVPVRVLMVTPSVVISRPTTASRPSTPLNPSLAPQIWLCWPLCVFINYIYLLTVTTFTQYNSQAEEGETFAASLHKTWSWRQASRDVGWDLAAFSTQIWLYNAITGLKYSQNHTQ